MQDDLWCSSNLNLLLLLSSPSSCMCSSHPAQALGWPRFLIVERSQILASSLILPPSGATHPPTPKAKYGSNLPRGSSIDLGPFKQLEATLDSADCPSLLLKLERERKLKRSFVTKMRELAKKVCRVLEVLSPLC